MLAPQQTLFCGDDPLVQSSSLGVRFMEDDDAALTAMQLTLPAEQVHLVELYNALRLLSVQVVHIALRKGLETMSVLLHLVELDGSRVSPQRRALAQAAVLELLGKATAKWGGQSAGQAAA